MVDFDRFSQGLPDPAEGVPVGVCCDGCMEDIFAGEGILVIDSLHMIVHDEPECINQAIGGRRKVAGEFLNEGGF